MGPVCFGSGFRSKGKSCTSQHTYMSKRGRKSSSKLVKLSDSKKFELIRLVREHDCLWNHRNPNYHKTYILQQEWEAIAVVLDVKDADGELIKEQWHSLRTYFLILRRDGHKLHSGDDWDESYAAKWQFYEEMKFLKETLIPRSSKSNLDATNAETAES